MEIKEASGDVYRDMKELADDLPDNSPRYVLLSYPLTMVRRQTLCEQTNATAETRHRHQAERLYRM